MDGAGASELIESSQESGDGLAELCRRRRDGDVRLAKSGDLLGRRPLAAADDGARVPHPLAGWRGLAGDEGGDRLLHVGLDEAGGLLLGGPADLADHEDRLRLRVALEHGEAVDEVDPLDRIAADADGRRL